MKGVMKVLEVDEGGSLHHRFGLAEILAWEIFNPAARGCRKTAVWLASPRTSRLRVHPFDILSARCAGLEWIRKVLRFPRNLVAPELHDAHSVGWLAVI